MTAGPEDYASALARMAAQWALIAADPGPVPAWRDEITRMTAQHSHLRATGQWRTGGRTLMSALGVHHHEVILCRGLAWLLTPDGWHGLGSSVLDGLLGLLGASPAGSERAVVVAEEIREIARADIVVRFEAVTVLIEAKVWAFEQDQQADRLARGWAEESPYLVFLTRDGRPPDTARDSAGRWHRVAWSDLATIIEAAVAAHPDCAPGAREYLHTLQTYGGTRS